MSAPAAAFQLPASGHEGDNEFINEYESECQCEFLDPRFLAITALDSEQAALEYFYQSPFYMKYRERALNENLRAGHAVDSQQVGLMFQVTYSNLEDINEPLKQLPPMDEMARIQHYSNAAVFHITLFQRNLGQNGVTATPMKVWPFSRFALPAQQVYYIIQGSIFMCPPFGSLIRHRLHQSIEHFEKFYDTLNDISKWSATNGYSWEPKPKALDPQIKQLCEKYGFQEEQREDYIKDGNMHVFFLKPQEHTAHRVAYDEMRILARRLELAHQVPVPEEAVSDMPTEPAPAYGTADNVTQ
ncbi:-Mediator of RNA polymerase II transcription subunit 6 [Babesia bigemina]|uniref:Mediator of RNA polymerase II transcription subunit 6 n=1 Tax=Babesia bigemina TaxID=5866 RepID=A0A061DBS4_BABBI|nr:-Mediator of RNA polymerase II transcription subunit 6 [Babesia bigemina]CDR98023.1 -Mediator of RNA polymerase II transcription subunit 6 [Babesia bigemina]|eukprot:XP_012770209.1 -Mediator of RNA polymerase II transcription subunit 6 [Babesia bigemina]